MTEQVKIDYLDEDEPISGQTYALVSFVSPEGVKNTSLRALKIRGVFSDLDSAQAKAEELNKKDKYFHIFVVEVGKWTGWDPELNENNADKQRYHEKELQELVKNAKVKRDSETEAANQRKKAMIAGASRTDAVRQGKDVDPRTNAIRDRLRKKLEEKAKRAQMEKVVDGKTDVPETNQTNQTNDSAVPTETTVSTTPAPATVAVEELKKTLDSKKSELSSTEAQMKRVKELIQQRQKTG